jgi:hypothetical protein
MHLTITQNGALYALQHGATKIYGGTRQKRTIANKVIRNGALRPASLAGGKIQKEEICFI